jgi:hypothetical protein
LSNSIAIGFLLSRQGGLLPVHRGKHHDIAGPSTGATLVFINPFAIFHGSRGRFGLHGFPERHRVIVNPQVFCLQATKVNI